MTSSSILGDYDTIVAVTQESINATMDQWLYHQSKEVLIYGKENAEGKVKITTDVENADYSFSATISPVKDKHGNWINLVVLRTSDIQKVQFNITFKDGLFNIRNGDSTIPIKQGDTDQWNFSFIVNLAMQHIDKSKLTDEVKEKLQNVDEDMFSIQQLYMDLTTASLMSDSKVDVPSLMRGPMEDLLTDYLVQQRDEETNSLGILVTAKEKPKLSASFAPTSVNFCVTPYLDKDDEPSNPNLDTLNYLVMTGVTKQPTYAPKVFGFNWVDDSDTQGVMAIKNTLIIENTIEQFNPILKVLSPIVLAKIDPHQKGSSSVIELNVGDDHVFKPTDNNEEGIVAHFDYTSKQHDSYNALGGSVSTISAGYEASTQIICKGNQITLSGSITVNAATSYSRGGGHNAQVMPETKSKWSITFKIYADPEANGQLSLVITEKDFDSPPVIENDDRSGWAKFLDGISGTSFVDDIGDLRNTVQDDIVDTILPKLKSSYKTANHFIFPGGETFAFKDPSFNDSLDMQSTITYLNPNA